MKELICIVCPRGCHLKVEEGEELSVRGNGCLRGVEYGKNEVTHPMADGDKYRKNYRCAASAVSGQDQYRGSQGKNCGNYAALTAVTLTAPVYSGQIVIAKVAGTSADIVCTRSM